MKYFFLGGFLTLIAMSVIAWRLDSRRNEAPDGRIAITWTSDDNPARREQIELFNRLHPKIDLRLDPVVLSLEKVIVQCLARSGPDLIDAKSGMELAAFVNAGIAWDITDELKARGIDIRREVWPALMPDLMYEGRVYAVGANAAAAAIWYNKALFQREKVPLPEDSTTWQDLILMGKRLTLRDRDGRVKRFGLAIDWRLDWPVFLTIHGARIFSDDGTRCVIDSPTAIEAVQMMQDLVYRDQISPSPAQDASLIVQGGWGGSQIARLAGGKVAMAMGGRYWLCSLRRYKNLDLGVVAIPGIKTPCLSGFGRGTIINRLSPHRREALDFLLFQLGREYNELINHQADGMGPVMRFSRTSLFLSDPAFPQETYNAIWRESMERALPQENSIFANGLVVERLIRFQLEQVWYHQRTPAEAMRTAARLINDHITENLRDNPSLQEKWKQAHAGKQ